MIGGRSTSEHAEIGSPAHRALVGLVRRLVVKLSSNGIWQFAGFRAVKEAFQAEVFQGVGLWARPAAGVTTEAVVVHVGADAAAPVAIAIRDKATQDEVAGDAAPDTTLVYNTTARVEVLPDGSVEVRLHGGVAVPLMTKADGDALRSWLLLHKHLGVTTGAGLSGVPDTAPAAIAGTTVLKGQ